MKNIILVGCSGHAKVVMDIVEREGKYKIVALFDHPEKVGTEVYGYKVVGHESEIPSFVSSLSIFGGIVAIGDNYLRKKVSDTIYSVIPNFQFVNAIHPSAQIGKNVKIGHGTVVIGGAIVNADAVVGKHCVLNTNSSLGHEGVMQDFSSLSSNATIGGGAKIGAYSTIALSATVLHNRKVGNHTVIGAGAVVTKDIPAQVVAYGTPCRVIKKREIGEKYL